MEKQRFTAKSIALMGVLMALDLILSRFFAIPTQFVKISFAFIPLVFMGMLYTPIVSGSANALSDFIGANLFPTGPYFPGFTLTAFLSGFIYSTFYYKKEMTLKRIITVNLIVTVFLNLGLNTLWLYMMFGKGALAFIPSRIISSSIMFVVHVFGTYWLGNVKVLQNQLIKFNA
ncbi:folate family ECF transporter S component [Vagococcus fluvialis]|uniref:folate family ECF transporter S component n=1 Tax=Vagococcus fluvialis TaxID=2738 RepID=UPI001A8F2F87|nr:folate family ECF transporter S component [Vagococcus fluvialis]MBO0438388.1 folate family ECF transporter S component [Vagococcus fluvialis]